MRRVVLFSEFIEQVEARKRELGLTDADFAAMQNNGRRRTPEKRELLRRMAKRTRAAGLEPLPAKY